MFTKFKKFLEDRGQMWEKVDSIPMEVPFGAHHPPSLEERMKSMIRHEFSRDVRDLGAESFEEADDFDVPDFLDDEFKASPYEENFDHDSNIDQLKGVIDENKKASGYKRLQFGKRDRRDDRGNKGRIRVKGKSGFYEKVEEGPRKKASFRRAEQA